MIARAILSFIFFFSVFFSLGWALAYTKFFNRTRVKNTAKVGSLATTVAILAAAVVGFMIMAEKYL